MREVFLKDSKRDEGTKIVLGGPLICPIILQMRKLNFRKLYFYKVAQLVRGRIAVSAKDIFKGNNFHSLYPYI